MNTIMVPTQYIDAHCHLATPNYTETELKQAIERSRSLGITGWVQGGIDPEDWKRQLEVKKLLGPNALCSFGLHPWWVSEKEESEVLTGLDLLEKSAAQAQTIGEMGLDQCPRFKSSDVLDRQIRAFEAQIEIAKRLRLPMILGFFLSISESITKINGPHPSYKKLKDALLIIPVEKLMVETDSNEPANLIRIAQALADHLKVSEQDILAINTKNIQTLFNIT